MTDAELRLLTDAARLRGLTVATHKSLVILSHVLPGERGREDRMISLDEKFGAALDKFATPFLGEQT